MNPPYTLGPHGQLDLILEHGIKVPRRLKFFLRDMYDLLVSLFTDMSKTTEVVYKKKKEKKNIRLIRDIVLVTLSRNILEIRLEIPGM